MFLWFFFPHQLLTDTLMFFFFFSLHLHSLFIDLIVYAQWYWGDESGGGKESFCSNVPASSLTGSPFYNPRDVRKSEDVRGEEKNNRRQ